MGSPEGEPARRKNEGPRHRVTLTRGYWLADTACTQALWQAATGANPSDFRGDPQRPVENVSWRDVQEFLGLIGERLPGCLASLPTEAQWEHACRAGTETAFSFGSRIRPEQVNYDGNFPYAGGEKGRFREETVAVKILPPNPWGLYEMHGNVWGWCADGRRGYEPAPCLDPKGPGAEDPEAPRDARGGSWLDFAWRARSAYRDAIPPGYRLGRLGFRFCLRSIDPGRAGRVRRDRPEAGGAQRDRC